MILVLVLISIVVVVGFVGYWYAIPYIYLQPQVDYSTVIDYDNVIYDSPVIQEPIVQVVEPEIKDYSFRLSKYQEIRDRLDNIEYNNNLGNSNSTTIELCGIFDKYPPVTHINITGTYGLNGWYIEPVSITFNSTDVCTGIKRIVVWTPKFSGSYVSGTMDRNIYWQLNNGDTITLQSRLDKTYPRGTVDLYYFAIDDNLNQEDVHHDRIHIDRQSPYLYILDMPNPYITTNRNVTFSLHASDFHSGIDKIMLRSCMHCEYIVFENDIADSMSMLPSMYVNYTVPYNYGIYRIEALALDNAGHITVKKMIIDIRKN